MDRYVCVHGHFYQPPRENPTLEAVELQDSAYPYHDWNERVTAECYAPNAASRLLDCNGNVEAMLNNYSTISFNFGPTLLSWMETNAPTVYRSILEANRLSSERFGGHGSAIAQAYNHMIMPLANCRDKITQVRWGIADFCRRFGRTPEGMWLPETAVDSETLQILADHGIKFTILAPGQASRVRRVGGRNWKDVSGARIDPSRAYLVRLPARRSINVFFYDGPISHGVAFEGLLNDGQRFADRLFDGFSDQRDWPQLSHIATDGESYGHHHHRGEMALTYALHQIETSGRAELTNYGQFLERFPPNHLADVYQNTSWSCAHGVERWRNDCGCNSGARPGWNQQWRAPLRAAFDWLRDTLSPAYEEGAQRWFIDPWEARNKYVAVILDRSPDNVDRFLSENTRSVLSEEDKVTALKLLEMQRHAMLMYTSCGWFFDELSGTETVQVIQYASRALQLAQDALGLDLEAEFLDRLRDAKSNIPEHGDGAQIYEKCVKPAIVDIPRVAAHYAISSLFENRSADQDKIYCYDVKRDAFQVETEGKMHLATGRAWFGSQITHEAAHLGFAVLHMGDHNVFGGVGVFESDADLAALRENLGAAFAKADTAEMIRLLSERFGKHIHSLRSLFRDERRKILDLILNDTLADTATVYRGIYDAHAQLIRFLIDVGAPVPKAFQIAAEIALNSQLHKAFGNGDIDGDAVRGLFKEASTVHAPLDVPTLEYAFRRRLEAAAEAFVVGPGKLETAQKFKRLLDLSESLPFPVNLWEIQKTAFGPLIKAQEHWRAEADRGNSEARDWLCVLTEIRVKVKV